MYLQKPPQDVYDAAKSFCLTFNVVPQLQFLTEIKWYNQKLMNSQ